VRPRPHRPTCTGHRKGCGKTGEWATVTARPLENYWIYWHVHQVASSCIVLSYMMIES
jgi:hypothetical protein